MASNEYHFNIHWQIQGTDKESAEVLGQAPDLARWWPSVYLDIQEVKPGDEYGIGKVVKLCTKGWLPDTPLPPAQPPDCGSIAHRGKNAFCHPCLDDRRTRNIIRQ